MLCSPAAFRTSNDLQLRTWPSICNADASTRRCIHLERPFSEGRHWLSIIASSFLLEAARSRFLRLHKGKREGDGWLGFAAQLSGTPEEEFMIGDRSASTGLPHAPTFLPAFRSDAAELGYVLRAAF